ncbi:MAG: nucleoside triphosphate pyrophosphohydrolase [Candidatus Melainabacteria bacterium]|nr:nucleoside triphosphate pyrophosphohydrolase [Candidatus Melainabacteria bacterium]
MKPIEDFIKTVAKLRAPDGCPWDKEQTHKTLKRYLIEEAYETIDAIDNDDSKALMEELGDVLLQVVLHSQIAKENNQFSFDELVDFINKKMISRHPHVFSDVVVKDTAEVLDNWEKLKKEEKPNKKTIFEGIPNSLPALLKALKVSKKAARDGFEWEKESDLWKSLDSETNELKEAINLNDKDKQREELGDLLFMIVNISRWYKLDPEESLNNGIKKFIKRFNRVQNIVRNKTNKELKEISPSELNKIWEDIKKEGEE